MGDAYSPAIFIEAEVAQTYSSLRAAIGSTDVLAVMPHSAIVSIISGPVCSGGTY